MFFMYPSRKATYARKPICVEHECRLSGEEEKKRVVLHTGGR